MKVPPRDIAGQKTFCVRLEFNKRNILTKGIEALDILLPFVNHPNYFIVNSTMTHEKLFFRFYLRKRLFESSEADPFDIATREKNTILQTVIRGIDDIKSAFVHEVDKFMEMPDGKIS